MRRLLAVALALIACGTSTVTSPSISPAPSTPPASRTPAPLASVVSGPAPSLAFPSMDCAAAQATQFDFWVGTWEVTWTTAGGAEAKGTNTVTKQSCVVLEHFDGPLGGVAGYIGNSAAAWVPTLAKWQQNYVDTGGFAAAYIGGREGDAFILYRATPGGAIANTGRLVWKEITADRLVWTNDLSRDNGATWTVGLTIIYTRKR